MPIGGGRRFSRNRDNQPLTSLLPVEPIAQQPTAQARGGRSRFGRGGGRRRGREPVQDLAIGDRIEPFGFGGGNDPMEASGLGFVGDITGATQPIAPVAPGAGTTTVSAGGVGDPVFTPPLSPFRGSPGFDFSSPDVRTGDLYGGRSDLDTGMKELLERGRQDPYWRDKIEDILRRLFQPIPAAPPETPGPPEGWSPGPPIPGRAYDPNPRGPAPRNPFSGGFNFQFPVMRF
jgi:hypothetical protein